MFFHLRCLFFLRRLKAGGHPERFFGERCKVRERVHREQRLPRPARRRFWTLLKRCLLRKAMRRRASRRSVTWLASRVDCRTTFLARRNNSTELYWSEHLRCLCHNSSSGLCESKHNVLTAGLKRA